jgi:hypothetical protein
MPIYLGKDVSDDYLQALIGAYREGYDAVAGDGASADDDQTVIDSLTENHVVTKETAKLLGGTVANADEEGGA